MLSLSRNWWLFVLRGLLAIVFGVVAFLWPGGTLFALVMLFGAYAIVDGLFSVFAGIRHAKNSPRWWVFLLEGLVSIGAGVAALIWPGVTTLIILAMIAAWAILTGVLEIVAAIRLRREITNEWMLALGGILSVALGVMLILQPLAGTLFIVWTLGAYALIFGVLLIILGFRLKGEGRSDKPQRISIHHSS